MLSFNPGPSAVVPELADYFAEALASQIVSISHRSAAFSQVYQELIVHAQRALNVPSDYSIFFYTSATECWSVIAEGLVTKSSLHLFSGDFGERWYETAYRVNPHVARLELEEDTRFDEILANKLLTGFNQTFEIVCITQNETSNGTQIPAPYLREIRNQLPDTLIAVDVTSSWGGLDLPIQDADLWFASVQKCFGLPAGLALMAVSPRAVAKIKEKKYEGRFNSLYRVLKNSEKFQTTHTPNVLGIFLLKKVLENRVPLAAIDTACREKAALGYHFFEQHPMFKPRIQHVENRSQTVLTLDGEPGQIQELLTFCRQQGVVLGSGYGGLKANTFRIANFPQHTLAELQQLLTLVSEFTER
jgi:phosphoserine aminotransferase